MAFDKNKSISRAQKFIQSGKIDQAINEYLQIVKNDPKDVASLQKLAGLYAKKQAFGEAVQCYQKVGESFRKSGFYQKSLAVYKIALQHQPENPGLMQALGELYQTLGLKAEALLNFRGAVQTFMDQDNYPGALLVLEMMVELSPDDPTIKARYGEALFHAGRKEDGVQVFRELSSVLAMDGKYEDLARFYERILSLDKADHAVRKDLAKTYVRLGLAPKALRHLKTLFDAHQADAEVFDLVGRVYVLMGKNQKAVAAFLEKIQHLDDNLEVEKTYQRILEIDPTNEEALRFLGEDDDDMTDFGLSTEVSGNASDDTVVSVAAGELDEMAEDSFATQAAGSSATGEFAAAINEASVYMKYGIVDRAIEQLGQIIAQDPNNIPALEKLIKAYEESGDQHGKVGSLVQLAELYEGLGDMARSSELIAEAEAINADHPRLKEFRGEEVDTVAKAEETAAVPEETLEEGEDLILGEGTVLGEDSEDAFLDADAFLADETEEPVAIEITEEAVVEELIIEESFEEEIDVDLDDDLTVEVEEAIEPDEGLLEEAPPWQEEVEHAKFFVEQGLLTEAEGVLGSLPDEALAHPAVAELRDQVARKRSAAASEAKATPAADENEDNFGFGDDAFDLASELESELDFLEEEQVAPGEEDVPSLEEIFDAFKEGVKAQLSEEDGAAHYDLGIAYMEMGLVEDAIREFEVAAATPEKEIDALNMIAVARTQRGELEMAKKCYEQALASERLGPEARLNLHFEIAVVLEEMKEYRASIQHYKAVVAIDKGYRNVLERVRQLKEKLASKG